MHMIFFTSTKRSSKQRTSQECFQSQMDGGTTMWNQTWTSFLMQNVYTAADGQRFPYCHALSPWLLCLESYWKDMGPLSKHLAGVIFSNTLLGETLPPFEQDDLTEEEQSSKLKQVLDNAGASLCGIWNEISLKDIPVESVYKCCDHVDELFHDLDDLKWYLNLAPSKIRNAEKYNFSPEQLAMIQKYRTEHMQYVNHADRRLASLIFSKCCCAREPSKYCPRCKMSPYREGSAPFF